MRNAHAPEHHSPDDYGTFGADYKFGPIMETIDPGLRQLCERWHALRGNRLMPSRAELKPLALRGLLKIAQLFDVIDCGRDFRFRVMGSVLAEQAQLQVTGKCISELENAQLRTRIHTALWRVCETREPIRLYAPHSAVGHLVHKPIEAVYLPLGDENGITQVLSAVTFHNRGAD